MKRYFPIIAILFITGGCYISSRQPSRYNNFAATKEIKNINVSYAVYHRSDDSSDIFFNVQTSELNYQRSNAASPYVTTIRIAYKIYELEGNRQGMMTDSASVYIMDKQHTLSKREIFGSVSVKLAAGKQYKIKVVLNEVNGSGENDQQVITDKTNVLNKDNFILLDQTLSPVMQRHSKDKNINIQTERNRNKNIFVRYYNRDFGIALPPFSSSTMPTTTFKSDSVFIVPADAHGRLTLPSKQKGFYHLQADSSLREGFTMFCFNNDFPEITSADVMIQSLLYICSRDEYNQLITSADKKDAVDQFWIKIAGSKERAKELIKNYYSRVEEANREYSSYIEGWKTDKGMISIIFGKPGFIQKNTDSETWVYRTGYNNASVSFTFYKVTNPFSNNDYTLLRNPAWKPQWYQAVESWRHGRAYRLHNF